jgi:TrmH family RNA methyltransferase
LIRTAAAFGFEGVILSAQSADAFSPKVVQAGAGVYGALWLRRLHSEIFDTVGRLRESGYAVISACAEGHPFFRKLGKRPFVLVLGNEGNGVSEQVRNSSDYLLSIPIKPVAAESLNVGVAGGICMFLLSENAFPDQSYPAVSRHSA